MALEPGLGTRDGELHRGVRIGRYEVLTQLSIGGMAELFLAFTSGAGGFQKFVVVKRILPDARSNESFVRMFLDEARITALLSHPNIAQVYELGDDNGTPFIAMEFIAGQNVNQVTRECLNRGMSVPIGFSVAVALDLCGALHYAHSWVDPTGTVSPVVHRDVAQKNVMVSYQGAIKLLDFGIAKARGSLGRTQAGMVKGTTGYMSPEQVRGEELDGRSDLFGVGVMLHELLTGRRLFAAPTETEEMQRILTDPIPSPAEINRNVPAALSNVVMTALERDRSKRPPSALVLAKALERALGSKVYDADRRSAFMSDLFGARIRATHLLLQAAGRGTDPQLIAARAELQSDHGMVFPERGATTEVPAPSLDSSELSITDIATRRRSPWRPVVLASSACLLAIILVGVLARSDGPRVLRLRSFDGSSSQTLMFGHLSLATNPPVEVFDGDRRLGRTPIEVDLRSGEHRLVLRDSTGEVRFCPVEIEPDKRVAVRRAFEDFQKE